MLRFPVRRTSARLIPALVPFAYLTLPCAAQSPQLTPVSQQAQAKSSEPSLTLRTYSRMVTLEVVAKDAKGNHVTGLKPEDFQIFEQTPSKSKAKSEQKIASFREVSMGDLQTRDAGLAARIPAGISTNVVAALKEPIPPTIILVDGLNTDVRYQSQTEAQTLEMLQQLPRDVPVAVFLLGTRLFMLQDFTSDPKMLQAALKKAITTAGQKLSQLDPRIDPDSVANLLIEAGAPLPPEMIAAAFDAGDVDFSQQMDRRVSLTEDALTAIARHLSGYPGRKNLLWISTAFPLNIVNPGLDHDEDRHYAQGIQQVTSALSDARIAVYPINPAGVVAIPAYMYAQPEHHPLPPAGDPLYKPEMEREVAQQNTMEGMAVATGGRVCTGDNDLADCIHKAVDDSSRFYEIAYYPDTKDWNGEYHRIILNTKVKGLKLEYRQGYFATPEGGSEAAVNDVLQQAACGSTLDATAIFLAAKSLPPDPKETMKFYLMINPAALTFTGFGNGNREVNLRVGVCTFDETGKPLHYMSDGVDQKLTQGEYESLMKSGLPHLVAVAGPKPAAVRLAVLDVISGKVGSVFVKTKSREQQTK